MPGGKRPSSPIMYALILFVGLCIAAVALAIVFFVQSEGYRAKAATLEEQTNELATPAEVRKLGALVGEKQRQNSRLGTMLGYVDETTTLITGRPSTDASAEAKVGTARSKTKEIAEQISRQHPDINLSDSNSTGLIPLIEKLNNKLDNTSKETAAVQQQLNDLQKRFDDALQSSLDKEKTLSQEKEKALNQVIAIQKDYDELKSLMEKSSGQQVKVLSAQLDSEKAAAKKFNQDLLKSDAELKLAQDKIKRIQQSLNAALPPPDANTPAFKIDGRIVAIDERAKTVFINLGSVDHVYQGLTFAVYDKNVPMPKDGRGKAEIEVFNVGKNVSTARITQADPKNPILVDDVIANLIWDSNKTNVFVVAGDFDIEGNSGPDSNGAEKIKSLITRWGGKVEDTVSVDTDFLVLGSAPQQPKKPTAEATEADAAAKQKYDDSLKRIAQYDATIKQAQVLSVPIFNMERFLYFIGYKSQADRPGAF